MTASLYVTDGTTKINLLTGIDGFTLDDWTPSIPPVKQVWRESPLSDGRQLAMSRWANATETFTLKVSRFTQDDIIEDLQELRRLLLAAREYFIGGSDVPVWIEARGNCETNTRYAVICDWRAERDDDPYHKPFMLDNPAIDKFSLILERQHWRHVTPGTTECVELSATQAYYDASDGAYVPTISADDCYVEHNAGVIILNSADMAFGAGVAPATYSCGIRFRSVNIPQGATILYAYMSFEADAAGAGDNCNVNIAADDVDSAAVFSTYADFVGRTRTGAVVAWNAVPHWVAGSIYIAPNLVTVVQEVISRPGWVSGNPLAILIDNNASTASASRIPVAWDHAAVRYAPHLLIAWSDTTTRTFGRTATCNNEVYVANKHNMAQLTHIYVDDGGVFGANLIGAALPFQFLPAVPAVNDAVYFGIATGVPNSGPFCSLVFDISIAQTNVTTITWQYWNGAWVNFVFLKDNTNADGAETGEPFDTTGVNSVHWEPYADWATCTVNAITGYWVRALVGAIGGGPTAPTQASRDIYTIVTPYVDALASTVTGDIPALAKFTAYTQAGRWDLLETGQIYAALRSYDRGADFSAYINLADEQNHASITVADFAASHSNFATQIHISPTGRTIRWNPPAVHTDDLIATITIANPLSTQYKGEYRAFVRAYQVGGAAGDARIYLTLSAINAYDVLYQTTIRSVVIPTAGHLALTDLGKITLPPMAVSPGSEITDIIIRILGNTPAGCDVYFTDLILLPADECLIDTRALPGPSSVGYDPYATLIYNTYDRKLNIDSTIPRHMLLSELIRISNSQVMIAWSNRNTGSMTWQPNERQRWWFLQDSFDGSGFEANPALSISLQGFEVSRYLSMRGKR